MATPHRPCLHGTGGCPVGPELHQADRAIADLEDHRNELQRARQERGAWLADHPEATRRLNALDRELNPPSEIPEIQVLGHHQAANIRRAPEIHPPSPGHGIELDFGP